MFFSLTSIPTVTACLVQYMVILGVSTVLMFSVSVAVLAAPATLQKTVLLQTWKSLDDNDKTSIQNALNCCGFSNGTQNNSFLDKTVAHPTCNTTILNAEDVRVYFCYSLELWIYSIYIVCVHASMHVHVCLCTCMCTCAHIAVHVFVHIAHIKNI